MRLNLSKVLSIFKRERPPVHAVIVPRDVCRMTMAQWRATPDLCAGAAKALHDPAVRHMLDILRTEHLANYLSTQPMTIEERAIISARAEGYCIALNNFEMLGKFETPKEPLEETFEAPESVQP